MSSAVLSRRSALGGMLALSAAGLMGATRAGSPVMPRGDTLAGMAARAGRVFGTAVRPEQLAADAALRSAVLRDCSVITPEIDLKWNAVEPAPGRYRFGPADEIVAFAEPAGIAVRGHTLIWERSTPAWARSAMLRDRDWGLVERWFAGVMPRYRATVREWDVVNEPIDTEHGEHGLRRTSFQRAFGNAYISRALHTARRMAPDARLFINDYSFDYVNPVDAARRTAMLRLVERLRREDVPLDGIGLQAHLDLAKGPLDRKGLARFLAELAAFDLDIVVTELDVRERDRQAPLSLRDARVAAEVATYLDVALDQPAVKGVVTWGLSDRDSWLQDGTEGGGGPAALNRGLPYDAALGRKPMYWTIHQAFEDARATA